MNYEILIFISTLLLVFTIIIEIMAILSLRKQIVKLGKEMDNKFNDAFNKLEPLINALNKTTPLIEVVNAVTNLFTGKNKKKNKRK